MARFQTASVLAVDLGAKHVGAWAAEIEGKDGDIARQPFGVLLDLEEGGQQWAQGERRLQRGQSRGLVRRKTVKRFFRCAADAVGLPGGHPQFIRAAARLMNRRGFIPDPDENGDEQERGEGHFPREEFLRNIADDIRQSPDFQPLRNILAEAGMPPDEFANLAGNIANLPLRALRRFFRRGADFSVMRKIVLNETAAWKCGDDNARARQKEIHSALKNSSADILQWWRKFDPSGTIPPFESNLNRRPLDCPALRIDPARAAKRFGGGALEKIANALRENRRELKENIPKKTAGDARNVLILQRALDWSGNANPPFRLRRQVWKGIDKNDDERAETRAAANRMDDALGAEVADQLREFAGDYYGEVRDAQSGAWDGGDRKNPDPSVILTRCDRNAPRMEKIRNLLLARILGCAEEEVKALGGDDALREFLKGVKMKRGRQVYRVCEDAADLQKKHGNRMRTMGEMDPKGEVGKIFAESKPAADALSAALGEKWGRKVSADRFANPFSLAQIRNTLEDSKGRAGNCRTCAQENAWRAVPDSGETDGFRAAMLPSDSVRPFDGILGRILNAQAERLAAEKMRMLEESGVRPEKILLTVEQNQFKFTEDLDDVKNAVQQGIDPKEIKRRKARKAWLKQAGQREADEKPDRIREDACGVCPYTGESLKGVAGEFDHIVPRAETKASGGRSAFNSEANLIYCSPAGNKGKGANQFILADLHPEYLRAVFETADRAEVEKRIRTDIDPLLNKPGDFTNFANLRRDHPQRARALRHALFLPELRAQVIHNFLRTENKARVNGTQKFFARKLCESLKRRFREKGWKAPAFEIVRVHARDVSVARHALLPSEWKKPRDSAQGAISHIVDAAMAFAVARGLDADAAQKILPTSFRVVRMTRRPPWQRGARKQGKAKKGARFMVFGPSMFGERFIPVLVPPEGDIRLGFSLGNSVAVKKGGAELLKILAPFLRGLDAPDLAKIREKAKGEKRGFVRLSVDKRLAFSKMLARWRDDDSEFAQALDILEGMRFTVSKKKLDGEKLKALEHRRSGEIRKEFEVGEKARKALGGKKSPFAAEKGDVVYPAFYARMDLRQNWMESAAETREDPNAFLRLHFLGGAKEPGGKKGQRHRKTRAVFSLPEVSRSPGALWRVCRKNGGAFQLLRRGKTGEKGGQTTAGFARQKDGAANIRADNAVLMPQLAASKRIAPAGGDDLREPPGGVVRFQEWRRIPCESGRGVCAVALRTKKGEMSVRLRLPVDAVMEIAELCDCDCRRWTDLPSNFGKPPAKASEQSVVAGLLALPGGAGVDWKKPFRLAAMDESGGELEIRATSTRAAELHRMFNDARPKKR